jgi:hypothetical protein
MLDRQVDEIKKAGASVAEAHLRVGKPAEEILRLSGEIVAGLIVVGNQGLGGKFSRMKRFLMSSVSERVARCSVKWCAGTSTTVRPSLLATAPEGFRLLERGDLGASPSCAT